MKDLNLLRNRRIAHRRRLQPVAQALVVEQDRTGRLHSGRVVLVPVVDQVGGVHKTASNRGLRARFYFAAGWISLRFTTSTACSRSSGSWLAAIFPSAATSVRRRKSFPCRRHLPLFPQVLADRGPCNFRNGRLRRSFPKLSRCLHTHAPAHLSCRTRASSVRRRIFPWRLFRCRRAGPLF